MSGGCQGEYLVLFGFRMSVRHRMHLRRLSRRYNIVNTLTSDVHELARPSTIQQTPPSASDITFAQTEMR